MSSILSGAGDAAGSDAAGAAPATFPFPPCMTCVCSRTSRGKKKDFYGARIRFFFVVTEGFFFRNVEREKEDMESKEREGHSAPGGGGAAGKQLAQELTDIAAAKERLCADLRQLDRQHAVILCCRVLALRSCD